MRVSGDDGALLVAAVGCAGGGQDEAPSVAPHESAVAALAELVESVELGGEAADALLHASSLAVVLSLANLQEAGWRQGCGHSIFWGVWQPDEQSGFVLRLYSTREPAPSERSQRSRREPTGGLMKVLQTA